MKNLQITKIIWSLSTGLQDAKKVTKVGLNRFAGLKLDYSTPEKSIQFLDELCDLNETLPAVVLDLAPATRAFVKSISIDIDAIQIGSILKLGTGSDADIQISATVPLSEIYQKGARAYLGAGGTFLKLEDFNGKDTMQAEVVQLGGIKIGSPLHVPSTREVDTKGDYLVDLAKYEELLNHHITHVILPGFLSPGVFKKLRDHIQKVTERPIWFVAKVASQSDFENLQSIFEHISGVYVSRLDWAMTVEPASIPVKTKELHQKCVMNGKFFVTASQMLLSMASNITPTRAEVSDIANALVDKSDAIVLTKEIDSFEAVSRTLDMMEKIIFDVEQNYKKMSGWVMQEPTVDSPFSAVAYGAVEAARNVGAKAIVALTHSGNTVQAISTFNPPIPVIAISFDDCLLRSLALIRGVYGFCLSSTPKLDEVLNVVNAQLIKQGLLDKDDLYVFASVTLSSLGSDASNLFTIQKVRG